MRVLILCAVFCMSFAAQAVEYGYFSRAHTSSNWSHSVTLEEGDRFVLMNTGNNDLGAGYYGATFNVQYDSHTENRTLCTHIYRGGTNGGYGLSQAEHARTINGPCSIEAGGYHRIIDYKIIRAGEDESKFTVALNAQGTRMAIGNKSGTNGVARVFEFNGTDWEQLGSDVE